MFELLESEGGLGLHLEGVVDAGELDLQVDGPVLFLQVLALVVPIVLVLLELVAHLSEHLRPVGLVVQVTHHLNMGVDFPPLMGVVCLVLLDEVGDFLARYVGLVEVLLEVRERVLQVVYFLVVWQVFVVH